MGFFSWRCAASDRPVMAEDAVRNTPWAIACRVVVLFRDGGRIIGTYDGYGRVYNESREVDLMDYSESDWRMAILCYYSSQSFDQLKPNKHDRGQGFFYSDQDLIDFHGITA